jgi:hypothetical protein
MPALPWPGEVEMGRGNIVRTLRRPGRLLVAACTAAFVGRPPHDTKNSSFRATRKGTWRWQVTYSGDPSNQGTTSLCGVEQFTIANQ